MEPITTLTDAPDSQAREVMSAGLRQFNAEQAGFADRRPIAGLVSDAETKEVLGGLWAGPRATCCSSTCSFSLSGCAAAGWAAGYSG